MGFSALRPWAIPCSNLFKWHRLPLTRRRLPHLFFQRFPSRKRNLYNVAGPKYYTPCIECGIYHLWEPEVDGQFCCPGFLREDLAQYRSGGYHPVHLGDTMHRGGYKIVQKLG